MIQAQKNRLPSREGVPVQHEINRLVPIFPQVNVKMLSYVPLFQNPQNVSSIPLFP